MAPIHRGTLGNNCRRDPSPCGKIVSMATVDVIIPTFNSAKYLPFAIESVMSQTFDDWRILLVDDGSTDTTMEAITPFLNQLGPKLKFIKQTNSGPAAARNNAIRNSSAEFLALLDADDVWLPSRLSESLRCFADRPRVGLVYGQVTGIDPEGVLGGTFKGNPRNPEGLIAPHIYMRKVELPCPTIMFRKKCIDEVGSFDEAIRGTEDRDLWLRIALRYEVAFVPKVIAYYRVSPNSISANPQGMLRAQMQFISKNYGSEGCGWRTRRIALARAYKQYAEALSVKKQPWPALVSSLRAVALYPLDIDNPRTAGSLLLKWIVSLVRR
jgi:glycosyltransferase involved in cell wall biosynthesis